MKKQSTISYVADAQAAFAEYKSDRVGATMQANPATNPFKGGHVAVRSADNQITDDQGTVRSADNSVGLTTLDTPLTTFAVGYPGEGNLQETLDLLAPVVPAGETFQYLVMDEKQNWVDLLTNEGDIRSIGGEFGKLPFGFKAADGRVDEKGLTVIIDHRQGGQLPAVRQAQVMRLKNILLRTDIRRVFTTLDANLTAETSENWGGSGSADPDGTLLNLVDASGDARGINPNQIVFGGGASLKRKRAYRRLKAAGSTLDYVTSPAELAAELEVDRVINVNLRRQSTATAKAKIVGDVVYGYYAGGQTVEDPSNIKRFVDTAAGPQFQVFITEHARFTELTVWHRNRIICTSSVGIFKQPVTYT